MTKSRDPEPTSALSECVTRLHYVSKTPVDPRGLTRTAGENLRSVSRV